MVTVSLNGFEVNIGERVFGWHVSECTRLIKDSSRRSTGSPTEIHLQTKFREPE